MTPRAVLALRGPGGEPVDVRRTLDSHGFSELAPASLNRETHELATTVRLPAGKPRRIRVMPGDGAGEVEIDVLGPAPSAATLTAVQRAALHILRMDQDLSAFYAQVGGDPDLSWAATGAGRMLRSQTVFENVVKTVCTIFWFLVLQGCYSEGRLLPRRTRRRKHKGGSGIMGDIVDVLKYPVRKLVEALRPADVPVDELRAIGHHDWAEDLADDEATGDVAARGRREFIDHFLHENGED